VLPGPGDEAGFTVAGVAGTVVALPPPPHAVRNAKDANIVIQSHARAQGVITHLLYPAGDTLVELA
jgi:hypothetical protein